MNIHHYIFKSFILSAIFLCSPAFSNVHEFETAHLKSMGGAGTGGILAEEAAFLNPASLAFFTTSSVYVQKDSAKLTDSGVQKPNPSATGFVLADGNASMSGSISYIKQEEDIYKRKRWGVSFSTPLEGKSAIGYSIRSSEDQNSLTQKTMKYYQSVFGITHALDEKYSLGIVAYDPFKSQAHETKLLIGLQYVLLSYITGAIDFGGNYNADQISKTLVLKGALQIRVLDDFFIRFGAFNDKMKNEKGTGYGVAWVQPRLSFEFSLKDNKRNADTTLGLGESNAKETSLSASIRF